MSRPAKLLLAASGVVVALLVALLILPILFIDEVEARVRAEIDRAAEVRARCSWDRGRGRDCSPP